MALENMTGPNAYISAMVQTNPASTDPEGEGDDHLRGIKNCILNTFPNINGPVMLTDEQLNAILTQKPQVPIGCILDFAGGALPDNFLLLQQAPTTLNRTTYAALFAVIGTTWGAGDGSTTFGAPYIPQGEAALSGAAPGGATNGQIPAHTHVINSAGQFAAEGGNGAFTPIYSAGAVSGSAGAGTKNMPAGTFWQKIIRYQ